MIKKVSRTTVKNYMKEFIYKDAIEYECKHKQYFYEREKEFLIHYKDIILPHKYFADFVVFTKE